MKNLEKNRAYVLIFYCTIGALAAMAPNIFLMTLIMIIGGILWPWLNRRFYKMDEFEMQLLYRSGYYAFLLLILMMLIVAYAYNAKWEVLQTVEIDVMLHLLVLFSVFAYCIVSYIIKYTSKI